MSKLVQAKQIWPNLCLVFVTDHPGENRSCFQALDLSIFEPGRFLKTVELHAIKRFDLFPQNVQQHQALAKRIFGLLAEIKPSKKTDGNVISPVHRGNNVQIDPIDS